jgi:hypothetical protein
MNFSLVIPHSGGYGSDVTRDRRHPWSAAATVMAGFAVFAVTLGARQSPPATCQVSGHVTGLGSPIPGAAVTASTAAGTSRSGSTELDGSYRLPLAPGSYRLRIDLAGFEPVEREVALQPPTCAESIDVALTLRARSAPEPGSATASRGRGAGAGGPAGRASGGFQSLEVTAEAEAAGAGADGETAPATQEAALLLPPGFTRDANAEAIAITGDDAQIDRGLLNDRLEALGRGDFQLPAGDAAAAFGGGRVAGAGRGGGRGGQGAFVLGGRGARGRTIQATADYTFGGSALDASPYQLRAEAPRSERPYTRQNFGGTIGGPLRLPGLYDGNRTSFTVQYTGGLGSNLFDQYATVPTDALRAGDFSAAGVTLVDPATGQAFAGGRIPPDRLSPQALALLRYIPSPNLPGTTRNYHYTTTTESVNNNVSVRITHTVAGQGGRGGRGGGRGGGGRGGARGTSVVLNAQLQYRGSSGDQRNVFATLGGRNESSSLSVPLSFNVSQGRNQHRINVNLSRTTARTFNQFTAVENVAASAGIEGVATDPFAFGLPALSFSSITGLRDTTPSRRRDTRLSTGYEWSRPSGRHTWRVGGDFRYDRGSNHSESNANGTFVFTGLYTSAGAGARGPYDVADFLLGIPQQASLQYGPGDVKLTGRSTNLFLMDDWRARPNLTLNLGIRYELLWPFVERDGQLVNLDIAPGFTAAAPVMSDGVGAFTGEFPEALLLTDTNNLAPRVGVAWRTRGLVVRGGFGASYNAGTYSAIARQLATQPPFAVTNTRIGSLNAALLMEDALSAVAPDETTNNYGIEKDYVLGRVDTWNVDVMRNLGVGWALGANYTHTRGSSLDIVRAPNRDATGLRIEGVQPFTWQSAEGRSVLNSASFRLQRRQVRGLGGQLTYTIAKSRDNAPSIGGGGGSAVVAQDDQDLEAEWGRSNFDRRHRFNANLSFELPFGENRLWLTNGGPWAALLESWRLSATFSADSGTPLTPRVRGAARDVAQGLNGALRADYNGAPIESENPTIDQFFNTSAFSVPSTGLFGTSPRNVIIGPGSTQLDAQLSRDVRLGGPRSVSIQLRASNLLNLVNYTSVDTFVNSPTFGQILSVRPMRSAQLNLRFRF